MLLKQRIKDVIDFGAFHIADIDFEDKIYHYTSLDALQKSLESGVFRATEYHYLNDIDEFQIVDQMVLSVLKYIFKDCNNLYNLIGKIIQVIRGIQEEAEELQNSYYVMLFSMARDNLTLWTEFANFGCNMKLSPFSLQKGSVPKLAYAGHVLYTDDEKRDAIRSLQAKRFLSLD